MALPLNRLNAFQREAVLHYQGPLLILAGAGSGKTSTMAYRIAHLISARYIGGDAILGLSFTNKAAKELRERVRKLVIESSSPKALKGLTITTFHSLCARLLRAHADRLGFNRNFTILDQNDQSATLKQVLRNIKIDDRKFDSDVILFEIGQAKNRFLTPEQAEDYFLNSGRLAPDYALAAAASFPKYQDQLKVLNAMDFDDLIYYAVMLLKDHIEVRDLYNLKFRHILVDEYQDTNAAQFKILSLLTEKYQNICVVGDDDQSIYSWRGADPSHILGFNKSYPDSKVISLEQNYRSTSRILEAANHVIAKNTKRFPKKLWSDRGEGEPITEVVVEEDRAEADFVAEEILRRAQGQEGAQVIGTQPNPQQKLFGDFAILYRSNAQSRVFEEALRRRAIPYKIVGGLSFLARKEVKDVMAYWKLMVNPQDDASLRRIINWPARGIGKTSIEAVSTHAFQLGIPFFEGMKESSRLAPKAAAPISRFRDLIGQMSTELARLPYEGGAVSQWARKTFDRIDVKRALEEESDDPAQAHRKWENVEELAHSIGQFRPGDETGPFQKTSPEAEVYSAGGVGGTVSEKPSGTDFAGEVLRTNPGHSDFAGEVPSSTDQNGRDFLRDYLNRMTLEAQDQEKDEDRKNPDAEKNQVTLLTLHGAKGLEYPVVFLVGVEEGFLPHKRTIDEATDFDEERRLCYVGITRARDHLFLVRAKNRIRYGKPIPRYPSRFIADIPKDLIVRIDETSTPEFTDKEAKVEHEVKVKDFLSQIRANLMKS